MKASVIIPVKNGGSRFREVVNAVQRQAAAWPFELLVIDSGSRDGSAEWARDQGCRVEEIPASDFGHGRTRNLGGHLSSGEFIVYLTHDALPGHERWLQQLVEAAESAPDVGGAFGPHRGYPEARIATARELEAHFAGFGDAPNTVRIEDADRYTAEVGYRQFLHFFSNNNSCLRRSVWEQIPFPDVDFAEDQIWARSMLEAGFAKAFHPDAWVYHSHDFGVVETARRAFDESRALHRLFGYVLVPSLRRLFAVWFYLVGRDWRWTFGAHLPIGKRLRQAALVPALSAARLVGQYLGSREAVLPEWLARSVSRDKALQRG